MCHLLASVPDLGRSALSQTTAPRVAGLEVTPLSGLSTLTRSLSVRLLRPVLGTGAQQVGATVVILGHTAEPRALRGLGLRKWNGRSQHAHGEDVRSSPKLYSEAPSGTRGRHRWLSGSPAWVKESSSLVGLL